MSEMIIAHDRAFLATTRSNVVDRLLDDIHIEARCAELIVLIEFLKELAKHPVEARPLSEPRNEVQYGLNFSTYRTQLYGCKLTKEMAYGVARETPVVRIFASRRMIGKHPRNINKELTSQHQYTVKLSSRQKRVIHVLQDSNTDYAIYTLVWKRQMANVGCDIWCVIGINVETDSSFVL